MTKRTCVMLLVLALAMAPAAAQARMWVGVQLGGNMASNTDIDINTGVAATSGTVQHAGIDTSVIAGVTIGYDFVREGFGGYDYPDWMKYFSVATDFTFNRFDFPNQWKGYTGFPGFANPVSEGTMACWSFLFMGKYGFFPDSEVPFGRLQPYLAVGPGIMFSTQNPGVSSSSVDIALVTEFGIRYMALKNVSLDTVFRYRWCQPSYNFVGFNTAEFDAHQFSFMIRASYHF
ncbi:MAG: hypothetical protein FJ126_08805 [Deltaproteobacteria bacterium]|nr:hypothetical protein [Deltaproteobacteria bacterium]